MGCPLDSSAEWPPTRDFYRTYCHDYRNLFPDCPNPSLARPPRGPLSCRAGRQAQPLNRNGPDHPQDRLADNNARRQAEGTRMNEAVVLTPERILEVTEDVL